MTGNLYIVATPIGNLKDRSYRAEEILLSVDLIAAEDTRRARSLLTEIGHTEASFIALHEHNESEEIDNIIRSISDWKDVAVVSDAGTPLLSDPGFQLVRECWGRDIPVIPVPGPSSITSALSICPIPSERFYFHGFLSAKARKRREQLAGLLERSEATVFFEAPHRIEKCLIDITDLAPQRQMMIARELTKLYEDCIVGRADELLSILREREALRGEFVCIVEGNNQYSPEHIEIDLLLELLINEVGPSRAAKIAAQVLKRNRREIYQIAIEIQEKNLKL